ncbi:hypothetical protein WDW37_04555 [Bdellovibrionota bacterium FG-1]
MKLNTPLLVTGALLAAFSQYTCADAQPSNPCQDSIITVQLRGIRTRQDAALLDVRQVLMRYFDTYQTFYDQGNHEYPIYKKTFLGGEKMDGNLFSGTLKSAVCPRSGYVDTVVGSIQTELEVVSNKYSGFFGGIELSIQVLSASRVYRAWACSPELHSYFVRYNPKYTGLIDWSKCLRPGTAFGASQESWTEVNPFLSKTQWCSTPEDMEKERTRLEHDCTGVSSVELYTSPLTAAIIAEHLGLVIVHNEPSTG